MTASPRNGAAMRFSARLLGSQGFSSTHFQPTLNTFLPYFALHLPYVIYYNKSIKISLVAASLVGRSPHVKRAPRRTPAFRRKIYRLTCREGRATWLRRIPSLQAAFSVFYTIGSHTPSAVRILRSTSGCYRSSSCSCVI